jgi:general secretion pathway protein K
LLAVLWLSVGLAAIAFSVAAVVRGEVERAGNTVEGMKARYLAAGALDRALNYMNYGPGQELPNGMVQFWRPGIPLLLMNFPEGQAAVEIIPESSRLNVNRVTPEDLTRLMVAIGLMPMEAQTVAAAILDWRGASATSTEFDRFYLAMVPSFRAPHASLEQIEDLLSVHGVSPELYYGRYVRTPQGDLVARAGLKDCLSVYSSGGALDVNTVEAETMLAVGAPPAAVEAVMMMRRAAPIRQEQMAMLAPLMGPAFGRFRVGGDAIYTLRATARLRRQDGGISDLRRSAKLTAAFNSKLYEEGFSILRRNDDAIGERMLFDPWPR